MLRSLSISLVAATLAVPALAQPRREVTGRALWVEDDGTRSPASGVELVAQTGDRWTTGEDGGFRFELPDVFRPGEPLGLELRGVPAWTVGRPIDGLLELPEPGEDVTVELYRRGSELFWSDERLERFLEATLELSRERLDRSGLLPGLDLGFYLERWTRRHGWSTASAEARLEAWRRRAAKDRDPYRRGLAAFAAGEWDDALRLLGKAAAERAGELADARRRGAPAADEGRLVRRLGEVRRLGAALLVVVGRPLEALDVLDAARAEVSEASAPHLWADLWLTRAFVCFDAGFVEGPESSTERMRQAYDALQEALRVFRHEHHPDAWASAQAVLGRALAGRATTAQDPVRVRRALEESIAAFERALTVRTRSADPDLWAATLFSLAQPLSQMGFVLAGSEGLPWLAQSTAALEEARSVRTPERVPELWLTTSNNLATLLTERGLRSAEPEGGRLLEAATAVYREVLGETAIPLTSEERRLVLGNFGWSLVESGLRTGSGGAARFREAVEIYHRLLAEPGAEEDPGKRASWHFYLGAALLELGRASEPGDERDAFLVEALVSFTAAAEGYRGKRPEPWATAQEGRARTLEILGRLDDSARTLEGVLAEDPEAREAHLGLWFLEHHRRRDAARALALAEDWARRHQRDLLGRLYLIESLFVTGDFEGCRAFARGLLTVGVAGEEGAVARVYEIAALHVLGAPTPAQAELLRELAAREPGLAPSWTFDGTLAFVGESRALAPLRDWLEDLFTAAGAGDVMALAELERRLESPRL